jgi:hypothetical protein
MRGARGRRWRAVLFVAGVLLVGAVSWLLVLRARWQRDLDSAIAELEREVGTVELARDLARWTDTPLGSELADDNAAKWLIAGADAIVLDAAEHELSDELRGRAVDDWDPSELAAARAFVARHAGGLETMTRAVHIRHSRFPLRLEGNVDGDRRSPDDPLASLLVRQVHGARANVLAGRIALHDGDCAKALRHAEVLARQAVVLGGEPAFFVGHIGAFATWQLLELSREMLARCHDTAVVERWAALLAETELARWDVERLVAGEAAHWLLLMQRVEREGRSWWERRLFPNGVQEGPIVRLYHSLIVASRDSAPEVGRVAARFQWDEGPGRHNIVAGMLAPHVESSVERLMVTDAALRLARGAVAVRVEGLLRAEYPPPDSLPEVARTPAPYLREVPAYEVESEGARIALPRSAERWRERYRAWQAERPRPEPPFEYLLPALAPR